MEKDRLKCGIALDDLYNWGDITCPKCGAVNETEMEIFVADDYSDEWEIWWVSKLAE